MSDKAEHPVENAKHSLISDASHRDVVEFVHEEFKTRFTIIERPTVKELLRYKGEIGALFSSELYIKAWSGARLLIKAWDSPYLDLDDDIDEIDSPTAAKLIQWAAMQVYAHINALEEIPKN